MLLFLFLVAVWLILLFGFVVFFGAPYVPTLSKQKRAALELLDLEPGQTLLELGSGDGTMLVAAAEKGLKVIGYELNPLLVLVSLWRTRKYRKHVRVIWANFWWHVWPRTDGIYVFLLDRYMKKLDKKIIQNYPEQTVKLASFAFKVPDKEIESEKNGVYFYNYLRGKKA
jgi:16S rRNA A1518/A1519 N6-dimethyltransferase RsmA/KsgA/DIM1 with predicted DNA glycosylase/AP lyase activity